MMAGKLSKAIIAFILKELNDVKPIAKFAAQNRYAKLSFKIDVND